MRWCVWAPLVVPWLGVPVARRLAEALPPRAAAWLLALTSAVLAALGAGALTLLALAGTMRLPVVAALGHMSAPVARQVDPVGLPVGVLAVLVLAAAALAVGRAARRHLVELREAARAVRRYGGAGDLTVLPGAAADAFALPGLPGRPGRVVVTAGMLRGLDPDECEVLLAHERAHLSGRHHLLVVCADLAACLHPALRALRGPLSFQLERWADENAARVVGDRGLTARAVARAALASAGAPSGARPAAAPGAATGPVPRRVAALLAPPQPRRTRPALAVAAVLAGCLLGSGGAALDAAQDLHAGIEWAQGARPHCVRAPGDPASRPGRSGRPGYDRRQDREHARDGRRAGRPDGIRPFRVPDPDPSTLL